MRGCKNIEKNDNNFKNVKTWENKKTFKKVIQNLHFYLTVLFVKHLTVKTKRKKVKSLPSLMGPYKAAFPVALSRTPAEAARPRASASRGMPVYSTK